MNNIYDLELEKSFLGYAMNDPKFLGQVAWISERDFSLTNRVVYCGLKSCLQQDFDGFSKIILIQKLTSLNIKIANEIDPSTYIEALDLLGSSLTNQGALGVAKKLKGTTIRRKLNEAARRIVELTSKDEGKRITDLVSETNREWNNEVNLLDGGEDDEPADFFEQLDGIVETIGQKQDKEGLQVSFMPLFQKMFGSLDPTDLSLFVARPKNNKSTLLLNLAIELAKVYLQDVQILYLDTEMDFRKTAFRTMAKETGLNEYQFKHGLWIKDVDSITQVRAKLEELKKLKGIFYYLKIPGKGLDEQISIIRRWHQKHVAFTKKKCLVILDYLKLGSADLANSKNVNSFLEVGLKIDTYKNLASELGIHVATAAQSNRLGEDEENLRPALAVGLSDMLSQFSSNVYFFKKLSPNQLLTLGDTSKYSHALYPIYLRNWGEDKSLHNIVKYKATEYGKEKNVYVDNFLLYKIDDFNVKEIEDFQSLVERRNIVDVNITKDANKKKDATIPQDIPF